MSDKKNISPRSSFTLVRSSVSNSFVNAVRVFFTLINK